MCTKSEVKTKNGALEDMKTVQYCWPRGPEEREGLGGAGEMQGQKNLGTPQNPRRQMP